MGLNYTYFKDNKCAHNLTNFEMDKDIGWG